MTAEMTSATNRAGVFKLLADPTRLAILTRLAEKPHNVTELCDWLADQIGSEVAQPMVSHHLCLLRVSGIVLPQREGKFNFYDLTEQGKAILAGMAAVA